MNTKFLRKITASFLILFPLIYFCFYLYSFYQQRNLPLKLDHVPQLDSLDQKLLIDGAKEMKMHKVVFVGITRDNLPEFAITKMSIESIGKNFADYRVILFENDSEDGTKASLANWQKNNSRVEIISHDFHNKKRPSIKFLAECRNYYIEALKSDEYNDFDIIIMLDMDLPNGVDVRALQDSFAKIDRWDAVCSNGIRSDDKMYDMFAFRNSEFPWTPKQWEKICASKDKDQWTEACNNSAYDRLFFKKKSYYWGRIVPQGQKIYAADTDLMPVYSCFGGLAIYKKSFIQDCKYDSIDNDCEHVAFHECLREINHGRMFMNPSQIVRYYKMNPE